VSKILLIAQDTDEHRRLAQGLRHRNHHCLLAADAMDALTAIEEEAPDALVLDLRSPVLSQRDLRHVLQASNEGQRAAVLAVVGASQIETYDVSLGFGDFLIHPVDTPELLLRVRQALWRAGKMPTEGENVIRCGDLALDTNRYEVYVAGHPIDLTYKEFELLRFLATNQGKVFTREVLLNRVWGYDYFGGARTVDVHIRRLRSKIEDRGHMFIETVRNVGYRFRPVSGETAR